jgi:hypothetical protein
VREVTEPNGFHMGGLVHPSCYEFCNHLRGVKSCIFGKIGNCAPAQLDQKTLDDGSVPPWRSGSKVAPPKCYWVHRISAEVAEP